MVNRYEINSTREGGRVIIYVRTKTRFVVGIKLLIRREKFKES